MSSFARDSIFMHGCAHHYFCAWQCQCQERSQLDFIYTRIDLNLLLFFSYPIPFTSSHSVLAAHSNQISSYKKYELQQYVWYPFCMSPLYNGGYVKTPYLWKLSKFLKDCKSIKNNQNLGFALSITYLFFSIIHYQTFNRLIDTSLKYIINKPVSWNNRLIDDKTNISPQLYTYSSRNYINTIEIFQQNLFWLSSLNTNDDCKITCFCSGWYFYIQEEAGRSEVRGRNIWQTAKNLAPSKFLCIYRTEKMTLFCFSSWWTFFQIFAYN